MKNFNVRCKLLENNFIVLVHKAPVYKIFSVLKPFKKSRLKLRLSTINRQLRIHKPPRAPGILLLTHQHVSCV